MFNFFEKTMRNIEEKLELIKRGTELIIEESDLITKLKLAEDENKQLIVKLGADPTAPDLHLGHTVVFRKLAHFQQIGHQAVFLIGDFTGRIGDPTGRDKTRPPLSEEQVLGNARTYLEQIGKILDIKLLNVVYNSHWLRSLCFEDIIKMSASTTMAKLLEHNTFRERFQQADSIRFNEMLYPFMQGYDSVALKADIELGGTDQTFNLTFGRDLQRYYGQAPQVCITMPILPGTDGINKMSKSLGNYIGIDEPPYIMFEKVMRMVDSNIITYYTLLTDKDISEINNIEKILNISPETEYILEIKKELAYTIVKTYHSENEATIAKENYGKEMKQVTSEYVVPSDELNNGKVPILKLMTLSGGASSKKSAQRLIQQGGVYINNVRISDTELEVEIKKEVILKIGKTFYTKIKE